MPNLNQEQKKNLKSLSYLIVICMLCKITPITEGNLILVIIEYLLANDFCDFLYKIIGKIVIGRLLVYYVLLNQSQNGKNVLLLIN